MSFAETVETVSVAEEEHINEDEVSLYNICIWCVCVSEYCFLTLSKYLNCTFFPSLLQIEQAIECLVDIAKHGEAAAAKYTEEAPNEECKKMAEAFFMQG